MIFAQPTQRPDGFPGQRLVVVPGHLVTSACHQPVTRDLCVTHIGHFSAASGHFIERPHGTPQHILIACMAGTGTCETGGGQWRIGPGEVLFLPPKQAHIYQADDRAPWTIFWVHFRGGRAGDYLSALGVGSGSPVTAVNDPAALFEAFEDTFRHVAHGFGEAALIGLSTAFARMLGLVKVHQRRSGERSNQAENRLLKVLSRMREELARPWTLGELSRAAGLSAPHFTELCRAQTGLPPMALLTRLRLQHAMDLLQQGRHNVGEAAIAVGYSDPFYFSRLFKKHIGIPPSASKRGP